MRYVIDRENGIYLSKRLAQVCDLLLKGYKAREIGEKLGIQINTVYRNLDIIRDRTKKRTQENIIEYLKKMNFEKIYQNNK